MSEGTKEAFYKRPAEKGLQPSLAYHDGAAIPLYLVLPSILRP
jgi:hypothetical protein